MLLVLVKSAYALLQGKQAFIYLCAINARLPILLYRIRSALRTREVDKRHLSIYESSFVLECDLEHCM